MKVPRKHALALTLALSAGGACAQDVSFSQPYAAPLYLNPAYSGVEGHSRVGATCRYQWAQLGEPYTAYAFFADHYFTGIKSGVGLSAVSDRQAGGALVQSSVGTSYAYNLRVAEKTFVRFGLQALLEVTAANASKLIFTDMLSPDGGTVAAAPYAAQQRAGFDMALGSVCSHGLFFAGAALHHLLRGHEAEVLGQRIATPRKLTLSAGCNLPVGRRNPYGGAPRSDEDGALTVSPGVLYRRQGIYGAYSAGAYLSARGFSAGAFYGSEVASQARFFSLSAGYATGVFGLMYSFDAGKISRDATAHLPGTHEVSLTLKIRQPSPDPHRQRRETPYRVRNTPLCD